MAQEELPKEILLEKYATFFFDENLTDDIAFTCFCEANGLSFADAQGLTIKWQKRSFAFKKKFDEMPSSIYIKP